MSRGDGLRQRPADKADAAEQAVPWWPGRDARADLLRSLRTAEERLLLAPRP